MRRFSGADALLTTLREETASLHAGASARDVQLAESRRSTAVLEQQLESQRVELAREAESRVRVCEYLVNMSTIVMV
jgi:hypothetical protein